MLKRFSPFAVLTAYCLIAITFLRGILLSPGILMGGDWGLPLTITQMNRYFTSGFYMWSDRELLGAEQFFISALPFQILIGLLAKLGITGDIYSKLLLPIVFVFPAFTMYLLCRFFNCSRITSFLGGFLYMTLPFFFNYAAMGWLFVLLSMGILPLTLMLFIKSVREESISYSLATGILYSLAMIQSQSLVWYPIVFLSFVPYLITDRKSFYVYIKSLFIVFLVFIVLNAYWALPLFFGGGGGILNTNLAASTVSLGTWARLNALNIVRGWGSLFNEPYEASTINSFASFSFVLPLIAYSSLYIFKKNRLVTSLVLLSFVPIILFELGPGFIVTLPFSDLIRDIARFSVISSFSFVVLACLVLNSLFENKQKKIVRIGSVFLAVLLVVNTYPFWIGELYGKVKLGYDVRLRTYSFPPEYISLENKLSKEPADIKVLYLPLMGELSLLDDKQFLGVYRGIRDIAASYSPKPGIVGLSDRVNSDFILKFEEQINQKKQSKNLSKLLGLMNVKYVVARKNVIHPSLNFSGKTVAASLKKVRGLTLLQEWNNIALFENKNFLPHIYTSSTTQKPNIQSTKINPTKYHVIVTNAQNSFPLIFSETFHRNWKLFPEGSKNPYPEKSHFVVNGYANAWTIEPGRKGENMEFTIEFLPQRLFYIGSIISIVALLTLLSFMAFVKFKHVTYGKK